MRGTRLLTLVTIVALSLTLASGTALAAPNDDEVSTDGADLINNDVDDDEVSTDGADLINGNVGPPDTVPAGDGHGAEAGGGGDDVGTNGADLINQ